MGIQDLQSFLENSQIDRSCVGVDLVKIARAQAQKWAKQIYKKGHNSSGKFCLVVDGECCLDRLYGGYFSDWVCGGQWNRAASFLGQFASSLNNANIEIVVFFNGCTESSRIHEWIQNQLKMRNRISLVLKHVTNKGTPPPKVWWIPPSCLRPTLRMVLRNLNIPVFVTMDDHRQEVIAYCRENNCQALVADDAEYIAFDPPRYFSARHLKLTYKGTLESKEYVVAELMKGLDISSEQLCILAALMGNYILTEADLSDLHVRLSGNKEPQGEACWEMVKSLSEFVKNLQSTTNDLDKLASEVFVSPAKAAKLKQAIKYYLDGTKQGFFKYRSGSNLRRKRGQGKPDEKADAEPGMDTTRLASEAFNELTDLSVAEANACLNVGPHITVDGTSDTHQPKVNGTEVNGQTGLAVSSGSSSNSTSPARVMDAAPKIKVVKTVRLMLEEDKISLPPIASEIMRTVSERHTKGLMSPLIYQILTQGEIRLPVVMEDETHKDLPSSQLFYRPMRQMVYAILFNLHHLTYMARNNKDKSQDIKLPEIKIKEWIWSKQNPYNKAEVVKAEPLGWGVPTIQRLWFGITVDDKRRRLRAYLTCMKSDNPMMLNPTYVPQHLLVLATVLRYIMTFTEKMVLRKHELDALIATAMDPQLPNAEFNQELQVECHSSRSVQVGALVMTGVEYALMVNDACGAPIPWAMACPWLFFDGKLLASLLSRAVNAKNLLELCSHRIPQVVKVERMREAILDGLMCQWRQPPLPVAPIASEAARVHSVIPAGMTNRAAVRGGANLPPGVRGRGVTTGGRLEIAGVVVGNWGPNCRLHPDVILPPQVTSVGGITYNGNSSQRGKPMYNSRGGGSMRGKQKGILKVMPTMTKKRTNNIAKKEPRKQTKGKSPPNSIQYNSDGLENCEVAVNPSQEVEAKKILTNSDKKVLSPPACKTEPTIIMNGKSSDKEDYEPTAKSIICMNGEDVTNHGVTPIVNAGTFKEN